jgi:hypothetical protein
VAHSTFF